MHVGRRASRIDDEQRPEARRARAAVGEEPRAFEHRSGCGHQHLVELRLRAVDSLRVHDALDEHAPNRRARGLDIEDVEFRHHIGAHRDFDLREQRDGVVGGVAVSGEHDGTRERALAERGGIRQQHLAVAAVGAAGEQQDVGRERDDALDVGRLSR